jgi:hypothetical protein
VYDWPGTAFERGAHPATVADKAAATKSPTSAWLEREVAFCSASFFMRMFPPFPKLPIYTEEGRIMFHDIKHFPNVDANLVCSSKRRAVATPSSNSCCRNVTRWNQMVNI